MNWNSTSSVFAPDGTLLGTIDTGTNTANCAFGGEDLRTLYITGGGTLYSIRTVTPGRVVWPSAE